MGWEVNVTFSMHEHATKGRHLCSQPSLHGEVQGDRGVGLSLQGLALWPQTRDDTGLAAIRQGQQGVGMACW